MLIRQSRFKTIALCALFLLGTPTMMMAMELHSSAFKDGGNIAKEYTCDGINRSPPLSWSNVPPAAKSLVLLMHDPDAPQKPWDHWLVFNIPAQAQGLEKDAIKLLKGTRMAKNSWGKKQYDGPCPPAGIHRYYFNLYALDTKLELSEDASKAQILKAMQGHILAQTTLMAKYGHGS
jgi:Raf kinase inhibitor-like YbhB/YbcL family protein